jgi:hypothetical protein
MSLDVRKYKSYEYEGFVYKNTCLLKSIKIKRSRELRKVSIVINSVELQPSHTTETHFIFDFKVIREKCRNSEGETPEENDLIALEQALVYNQLVAIRYYTIVPVENFKNSVFTSALQIGFKPTFYVAKTHRNENTKDRFVEVEEEVYKSTTTSPV